MSQPEVPFGKSFRHKYFTNFEDGVTPVNHGSYGYTPTPIFDQLVANIAQDYNFPDRFIRSELPKAYLENVKALGPFLNCDYRDLALVTNATTGVNTVLRSLPFEEGDKIVVMSTVYGACKNTVRFVELRSKTQTIVIDLEYPLEDSAILEKVESVFKDGKVKLCMFDTITSMPGVIFPFKLVTQLCKKYDVISLIDGAHSIGLIPIDLSEIGCDFYTSNLHKWLYVPRGCAVLYANKAYHRKVHTLPVGHSYIPDDVELPPEQEENVFVDKFAFTGSNNFASFLCVKKAIDFRKNICGGEKTIYDYCHGLAKQVGKFLTEEKWAGMHTLDNSTHTIISTMINVQIPMDEVSKLVKDKTGSEIDLKALNYSDPAIFKDCEAFVVDKMTNQYKTMVPFVPHNGKWYIRLSCQIYNELADYDIATDRFLDSLAEYFAGGAYKKFI